jgi:flagellar assembly protein FliH
MAFHKLIAFDRRLAGFFLPGAPGRMYNEAELSARLHEAYQRGANEARAASEHQWVEMRAEMERLSRDLFERLSAIEPALVAQLREVLPGLAVEISRRLLAGYEPSPEVVERLCVDALEQLFPEREGLELCLSPRDAEMLARINPDWLKRYPGLRMRADAALSPGDCQVRSRFGLTDARQETKLAALERSLTGT